MKFKIARKIKTREIVELEESETLGKTLHFLSEFVVDEADNPIPQDVAYEQLLDLDLDDQIRAQEAFMSAILPNAKRRR